MSIFLDVLGCLDSPEKTLRYLSDAYKPVFCVLEAKLGKEHINFPFIPLFF